MATGRAGSGKTHIIRRLTRDSTDALTSTLGLQVSSCIWSGEACKPPAITTKFEFWEVKLSETAGWKSFDTKMHTTAICQIVSICLLSSGWVCSCSQSSISALSCQASACPDSACLFNDRQNWLQSAYQAIRGHGAHTMRHCWLQMRSCTLMGCDDGKVTNLSNSAAVRSENK